MKEYLVEAIKEEENGTVSESWDLFTYSEKMEAIEEAKAISNGSSFTSQALKGFTHVRVHEMELDDEYGSPVGHRQIASFEVK